MAGADGGPAWFSFPQIKTEQDGETKYLDIMQLTNAEREHVRALILADLQQQGHLQGQQSNQGHQKATRPPQGTGHGGTCHRKARTLASIIPMGCRMIFHSDSVWVLLAKYLTTVTGSARLGNFELSNFPNIYIQL